MIIKTLTPPAPNPAPPTTEPNPQIRVHLESVTEYMEEAEISSLIATESIPAGWDEDRAEAIPAQHTIALIHRGTAAQIHMIRWMLSTLFDIH